MSTPRFIKLNPRTLVRFGRRAGSVWQLTAWLLVLSPLAALGSLPLALVALAGLVAAWEWTGRAASSYAEIDHPALRAHPRDRLLAFLSGLALATGFAVAFLVAVGWVAESDHAVEIVIACASLLLGWLTLGAIRQGWRLSFSIAALTLMVLVGVFAIRAIADHPAPRDVSLVVVWIRMISLFLATAILGIWSEPVGKRTRWGERIRDWGMVIVPVTALLTMIDRSPGSISDSHPLGLVAWFIGWGGAVATVAILSSQGVIRLGRFNDKRQGSSKTKHAGLEGFTPPVVLSAAMPLMLVNGAHWSLFLGAVVAGLVFASARGGIVRLRRNLVAAGSRESDRTASASPALHPVR